MKQSLFILFINLALSPFFVFSQSYNFLNFDIGDGLAHNRVTDICEDQYGNLWLATSGGGLSKFNGLTFESYTIKNGLSSNYIRSILNDKRGNIWAATAEGISKLDGFSITNFQVDSVEDNSNSVNVLHEAADGIIWFSSPSGGLGRIDTLDNVFVDKIPGLISADRIIDIEEDNEGNIWFVSAIQGLFKYNGQQYIKVINNATFRGYLLSIEKDEAGNFWIGTNKGLMLFDPLSQQTNPSLAIDQIFVKSVEIMDSTNYWLLSSSGAMKVEEGEITIIGESQGLTNRNINTIYVDREGNTWFASDGEGLYKLTNKTFEFLGAGQGLQNLPVTCINKDKSGNYWFGSFGHGLSRWDGKNFKYYKKSTELPSDYITSSVTDNQGNIWFGTRGSGLIKYDGEDFTTVDTKDGLIHNIVRQLFFDSNNNLWIGTINGLSIYDGQQFKNFDKSSGLSENLIWSINESDLGEVLVVTRSGFSLFKDGELTSIDLPGELFDNRINTALIDSYGNFWLGYSGHGIVKVGKDKTLTSYTTDEGLGSDLIYSLIFDENEDLIVGTERGVYKLFLNSHSGLESKIKKYEQVEGFSNIQTTNGAVFKSANTIWYGNNTGVFVYNLNAEKVTTTQPLVYISDIKLFYNDVDWSNYSEELLPWVNIPTSLDLGYKDNNIVINYFGTSMTNPKEVKYKYRLIGLDNKWSGVTARMEAVYTNLPPGNYRFEVLAANSDNVWTDEPTIYRFHITPPFWQTWWFYLIALFATVLIFKLYNDYRIRVNLNRILVLEKIRAEEQKKARKVMARDFHDNLGNQLASISVYINLINLKLKKRTKEIDDLITNVQKYASGLFSGTKDFIWSMDPDSDELSEVYTYIKDFGEELFEKTPIEFFSSADDIDGKTIPLSMGWSRQLVLISKEAMTNALKHSKATEVNLKLELQSKYFVMSLSDNGVGIDEEVKSGSIGIKSIRNRTKSIGGAIEFNKLKNGTEVLLSVPIPVTTNEFENKIQKL